MNWETGEEDGSGWNGLAPNREERTEDRRGMPELDLLLYIRCMCHRNTPQINKAENDKGECGECIRQQCWKDILRLIAAAIEETGAFTGEQDAMVALERTLLEGGIGTFGVADELESSFAARCSRAHE